MSTLTVDTIQGKTAAGTVAMPSGHVIQVQSAQLAAANQFTVTSTTQADIMSVTITPKFASSKILFQMAGDCGSSGSNKALLIRLQRNIGGGSFSTLCGTGGVYLSGAYEHCAMSFMDSPNTTSACIYKLQGGLSATSSTGYFPTGWGGGGQWTSAEDINTITVMEIAQ
jgi:hypothetical protein